MEALRERRLPQDRAEVKSFIGMITFYHKFGPNLSTVLRPLYDLANSPSWQWTDAAERAYVAALDAIENQVLVPYSLTRPVRLTTDASPVGAAAILSHVSADGKTEELIAFASKTFSAAERNYPQHEREAAAIVFGLKKFFKYLFGREFEIATDNAPMVAIFGKNSQARAMTAARLQRWAIFSLRLQVLHGAHTGRGDPACGLS